MNSGSPTHDAPSTAEKSTSPRTRATTYPTSTPNRIDSRPEQPAEQHRRQHDRRDRDHGRHRPGLHAPPRRRREVSARSARRSCPSPLGAAACRPTPSRALHQQAHQGQQHTGDHDAAERRRGATGGLRRRDRREEGEARPEVAGQAAGVSSRNSACRPRRRTAWSRGEPRDRRHQHGGAEHRHHVLHADPDGARPAQPLVGGDDGARTGDAPVSVQLPEPPVRATKNTPHQSRRPAARAARPADGSGWRHPRVTPLPNGPQPPAATGPRRRQNRTVAKVPTRSKPTAS